MTTDEILPDVHADRETLMRALYETAFPPVARFVRKMNGTLEDAKDVFHDSLVIFFEKKSDEQFTVNTSNEAYLFGIARHLWRRKFKSDTATVSLEPVEMEIEIPEDYFTDNKHHLSLLKFLEQAGQKCLDLLHAFYYEKLPMDKMMGVFGYATIRSVTTQKYKCLEKVRDKVKEKSINYEDFAE